MSLYHRFTLGFRDVQDLPAEYGVAVSYEAVQLWCRTFGPAFARNLRRRQARLGDIWHLDEVFIRIRWKRCNLWAGKPQGKNGTRDGCSSEPLKYRVLVMLVRAEDTEARFGMPVLERERFSHDG